MMLSKYFLYDILLMAAQILIKNAGVNGIATNKVRLVNFILENLFISF